MKPVFVSRTAGAGLLLAMLSVVPAAADETYGLRLRLGADGKDGHYTVAGLALQWPGVWERQYEYWRIVLAPELELGSFHYHGDDPGPRRAEEVGGIAMFRIEYPREGMRPYGELGIGGALFNHEQLGGKRLSTKFQFSEHVGLGLQLDAHWRVGWRYSHYSNADIRLPNAGIDLQQLTLGYQF